MVEGPERNQVKVEHKVWRKCRSDLFQNAHLPEKPPSTFTFLTVLYVWPVDVLMVKLRETERQSEPVHSLIPVLSFVCA